MSKTWKYRDHRLNKEIQMNAQREEWEEQQRLRQIKRILDHKRRQDELMIMEFES
jgi:hypothetical protein